MAKSNLDEELWSLVDRGGAALDEHLALHPEQRAAADELRAAVGLARAVASSQPVSLPPRIARYRIEREIGRGGCGVVYEAWQEGPERRVALKVLHTLDQVDDVSRERFEREARALGRLSHAHIAQIHEAGASGDGQQFLAMELVHGPTLPQFVRERGLDLCKRVELFRDVCDAVHHAHQQRVIHRDLKPANVLVDRERGVKVVDFGLARLRDVESGATRAGAVLGTLAYMAPEQARGEHELVDERADVYSLGAILYELVAGAPPFDLHGKSALEALRCVNDERPLPPRVRVPSLDRDLETIVLQALAKEPRLRYSSAAALSADVSAWLAGRPVLARRPSRLHRLRKLVARNWLVSSLSAATVVLALALALSVTSRELLYGWMGQAWLQRSPFDALRWVGDAPQVELDGRWYDLRGIDGMHVDYVIGFCKQHAPSRWRKRFSEDLLATLNVMGDFAVFDVDLELRDLETGERVERPDVPLSSPARRRLWIDRYAWPFARTLDDLRAGTVIYEGRRWDVLAIDGLRDGDLANADRGRDLAKLYDTYCDLVGHSPPERVDLTLRDLETGEVRLFADVPRAAAKP